MTPERLAAGLRHAMELARATAARKQAENELRAEESRFRTLANAIPQFAWMADASGARYWFNQRWLDYTGIPLEELKGWDWRQVHHPDTSTASSNWSARAVRRANRGKTPFHCVARTGLIAGSCRAPSPFEDRWRNCRLARHEHGCYGSEKRGGRTGTAPDA